MSWFTITHLGVEPGTIAAANGKLWGFLKVRLDYDSGGHVVAVVPMWLDGMLSMRTGGKAWHKHWKRGLREGWVQVSEYVGAAEQRARELEEQPGNVVPWSSFASRIESRDDRSNQQRGLP